MGRFSLGRKVLSLIIFALLLGMIYMQYVGTHPLNAISPGALIWKVSENPSPGPDEAYGVARDSTGIYVVGYDNVPAVLTSGGGLRSVALQPVR